MTPTREQIEQLVSDARHLVATERGGIAPGVVTVLADQLAAVTKDRNALAVKLVATEMERDEAVALLADDDCYLNVLSWMDRRAEFLARTDGKAEKNG